MNKTDDKRINLIKYKSHLTLGIAFTIVGAFGVLIPLFENHFSSGGGVINIASPVFLIGGIIITVKSFFSYRNEKRKF